MTRSLTFAILFTLAGLALCTAAQARAPSHHTAEDMYNLYMDTSKDCGKSDRPAFLCSGIIIRAAVSGATWNSWDLSPKDVSAGGVSFSFLRKDIPFNDFEEGQNSSGFTLFPLFGKYNAPAQKYVVQIMCAFTLDGWTNDRDLKGCGTDKFGANSGECQPQGIMTAAQWVAHFKKAPETGNGGTKLWQCGFDVHTGSTFNTADAFMQTIYARDQLGTSAYFKDHNELRAAAWSNVPPADLPIQSFWYAITKGGSNSAGLTEARKNQKAYFDATKIFIPVVQITLPATVNDLYDFKVVASDQAVPFPA